MRFHLEWASRLLGNQVLHRLKRYAQQRQPSKHVKLGSYRPTSETPFGWRFAGGPILARDGMLAHKYVNHLYCQRCVKKQHHTPVTFGIAL